MSKINQEVQMANYRRNQASMAKALLKDHQSKYTYIKEFYSHPDKYNKSIKKLNKLDRTTLQSRLKDFYEVILTKRFNKFNINTPLEYLEQTLKTLK